MGLEELDPMPTSADVTPETENSFDWLFSALDGKPADGAPARILGIHDDGSHLFVGIEHIF